MSRSSRASQIVWIVIGASVLGMLVFFYTYEACDARCADWDFVDDLLMGNEVTGRVARWDHGPSVAVINGNALHTRMVGGAIHEISEMLSGTGMTLRFAQSGPADITVTFMPHANLSRRGEHYELGSGILGFCNNYTTMDGNLGAARIYVSQNLTEGETWGTLLHEFGHAMGVNGHTDRYLSSLFYNDFKGGARSDGYSRADRRILRFLYTHLRSGADEDAVRTAFERHWVTE